MYVLDNGLLRAEINANGQVISLVVSGDDRDVFRKPDGTQLGGGNQLVLFDDEPVYFDAWDVMDYHLETPRVLNDSEVRQSGTHLFSNCFLFNGSLQRVYTS